MMIDAVNTVVLRADETGISDKDGKLAHIYQLAPVLTDMDTLDTEVCTTMYRVRNDAENLPIENAYGVDFRMAYGNSNNIVELFYDMQHQRNFIRYYRSSAWQSWKEIPIWSLSGDLDIERKLHISTNETDLALFENPSGTNARIAFKGTNQSSDSAATIGISGNILVLRNNSADKLRIDTGNYVLPGIASTTSLGSSTCP